MLIPIHGVDMNQPRDPMPNLGRMMVFADGENMVFRYQDMLASGLESDERVKHKKDTFVWVPHCVHPGLNHVLRCTYYTYATGSEEQVRSTSQSIKDLEFRQYSVPGQNSPARLLRNLHPRVFRKFKGKKAKGVDIQLTVDILTNVYQDNLDTVYLISGDGDYRPVIEEAMRFGKQVIVAAFSSGLNEELKYIADKFINIDTTFFPHKQ
jgi:uncharacterized LabA/DUF88 family protein